MNAAICTLFEGQYHFGLSALVNSLYAHGFRGVIYAGYRGSLPPWLPGPANGDGYTEHHPVPDLTLRFIPLTTTIHFTNYKPEFMSRVWETHCPDARVLFYFDPDITVRFPWSFFVDWASDAVALCEDVNSPMPSSHPKRNAWRRVFKGKGHVFRNAPEIYLNGGFIGLPIELAEFLGAWRNIIETMAGEGIDLASLATPSDYRFWNNDQDALNIAVMTTACSTSLAGQEAMGFKPGFGPMLHAVGNRKPWNGSLLQDFASGRTPSQAQLDYWRNVEWSIPVFPRNVVAFKRVAMKLTALAGRFYGR